MFPWVLRHLYVLIFSLGIAQAFFVDRLSAQGVSPSEKAEALDWFRNHYSPSRSLIHFSSWANEAGDKTLWILIDIPTDEEISSYPEGSDFRVLIGNGSGKIIRRDLQSRGPFAANRVTGMYNKFNIATNPLAREYSNLGISLGRDLPMLHRFGSIRTGLPELDDKQVFDSLVLQSDPHFYISIDNATVTDQMILEIKKIRNMVQPSIVSRSQRLLRWSCTKILVGIHKTVLDNPH